MIVANPESGTNHRMFDHAMACAQGQLVFAVMQKPVRYAYEIAKKAIPDDPIVPLGFADEVRNVDQ
ncbi:hypothetical protein [uncultured Litoreibacter sp.]|uniref:hypothetical protein n=1 Tax=uncultured Litoreibacter sp. TaxID=1392394 RepID=UPI0026329D37|nr:hypothetical protein [uncultured Litoreibacter sp.]